MSKWVDHVKEFASKKGISYPEAMKNSECKESYKSSKKEPEPVSVAVVSKKKKEIPIEVPVVLQKNKNKKNKNI